MKTYTAVILLKDMRTTVIHRFESDETQLDDLFTDCEIDYLCEHEELDSFAIIAIVEGYPEMMITPDLKKFETYKRVPADKVHDLPRE
jgi:hypothetical protein